MFASMIRGVPYRKFLVNNSDIILKGKYSHFSFVFHVTHYSILFVRNLNAYRFTLLLLLIAHFKCNVNLLIHSMPLWFEHS